MQKKVLLIQPPVQDFYDTDVRLQPIGLCYLKAIAKKHHPHIQVTIKDYHQGHGKRTIRWPNEVSYLKPYYGHRDILPFCGFHHYSHFGMDFEKIITDILSEKPDLLGISSLFSPYYREALTIAGLVKENSNIPVLFGGSHVSAMPEFMLSRPEVDFIIRGEGERPFVEFLHEFYGDRDYSKVSALGFKKDGKIYMNPILPNYDQSEIPYPDLSDFSPQTYLYKNRPQTFVITSRSCPHKCSFCSVHTTFGTNYRRNSVDQVMAELKQRYAEGYRVFDFEDDNLTFYKDEMKDLCRKISSEFKSNVELVAMNGISYLSLDAELIKLMAEAGFKKINLSLVTSNSSVLKTTKRPHTVEKYIRIIEMLKENNIGVTSYQILGLPQEPLDSQIQTLAFNARMPVLLGASPFYLTPNSPIAGLYAPRTENEVFLARLSAMAIETELFDRPDIYTLFITTRIFNFLKSADIKKQSADIDETLENLAVKDQRNALGAEFLRKLFKDEKYYYFDGKTANPSDVFKFPLFQKIWDETEFITSVNGGRISLTNATVTA